MAEAVNIGNATLYHGDCQKLLPSLGTFDLLLTDPSYGARENVKRASSGRGFNKDGHPKMRNRPAKDHPEIAGDREPFDPSPFLAFPRVILWGANWYVGRLPEGKTKWLVWDKRCGKGNDDNADLEMAWTNLKGPDRMHRQLWRGFCREGRDNARHGVLHPMQKPIELMAWCLQQAGIKPGMRVLDPFMGSGPIGIATVELGAFYVGVEMVKDYFDISCRRIGEAHAANRREGELTL